MHINKFIEAIQLHYSIAEATKIAELFTEKFDLEILDHTFIRQCIERINRYEPIQYILEEAWFYDIPIYVNQHTLIPRPETEELVDIIIKENKEKSNLSIIDIGTGSGCIPIILYRKLNNSHIYAMDISSDALDVAKQNANQYKANIHFINTDFLAKSIFDLPVFDIIVSNPPYIPQQEHELMDKNVTQFEPHSALFVPNNQPLIFYEGIKNFAKNHLKPLGTIYVETHYQYAVETAVIYETEGYETSILKDISGNNRFVKAIKKP
ncbi:MAG: peptide chain release factor N(5)-glutamine methyltransferase [Chitinophagaceae bacterium]|nr:MAG: peptide chain release factor N(5)-glutamine methyltransferase [Chitinophagaceae bacterium]